MRALLLRLVAVLLAFVVAAQLVGALVAAGREREDQTAVSTIIASDGLAHLVAELDATPAADRVRRAHDVAHEHGVVAFVGEPAPPPRPFGPRTAQVQGVLADGTPLVVEALPLGRPHGPWLVGQIAFVALVVAAVVGVLARPIARDLDALGEDLRGIGGADLAARVRVPARGPVVPLAEAINALAARIQGLVGGQRALLQAVSHELRTPPARMRFRLEGLADEPDAAERARRVAELERDLDGMDALIAEVLSFVRFDDAPAAPASFDVAAAVDEAVCLVSPLREGVAIGRTGEVATWRFGVPERWFGRVVENLLTNAQRHARLRVDVRVEAGAELVVHVDDDGPGVPVADRARVLEPFVTGDEARTTGGVGLGLTIARRIVERGGGRLEIGDSPLGGARVTARFPGRP